MKVNLQRNWFDPQKQRRRRRDNPHNLPDDWKDQLPSDAEIVKEDAPVKELPENPSKAAKDTARAAGSVRDAEAGVAEAASNAIAGKPSKKK